MIKTTEVYEFKKGQQLHLDDIYSIQGVGDGKWWTADDPDLKGGSGGEDVMITEDITIKISISRKGRDDERE